MDIEGLRGASTGGSCSVGREGGVRGPVAVLALAGSGVEDTRAQVAILALCMHACRFECMHAWHGIACMHACMIV